MQLRSRGLFAMEFRGLMLFEYAKTFPVFAEISMIADRTSLMVSTSS